jgi:L-iditol 2-dehydrogenase
MALAKERMKACNLHGIGDLRYEDVPAPRAGPGEVLLRVMAAGICGSDIPRVFEKGTYRFPTIPGHEFAGIVVDGEDRSLAGKRAAVFPLIPCGKCGACQIGEYPQCRDYDYYGSRRDGAFAEYVAVKAWNLVLIPDAVSFEQAAMCEPCAVAIHALARAGVTIGDTVAVFGAGPIGLLAARTALGWGAAQAVLVDVDEKKLAFARELGFTHTVDSKTADPAEYIRGITGQRGADTALEAAGASAALEGCLRSVKVFGTAVLLGNPAKTMEISQKAYGEILRKQLTLRGTWNSGYNDAHNDWRLAIRCMASGVLQPEKLITHRFPLAECAAAFDLARRREELSVKIMFVNEGA